MELTLQAAADHVKGRVLGDPALRVRGVTPILDAAAGELTFAESERWLAQALDSPAAAVIVPPGLVLPEGRSGIAVENPKLAFARLLPLFHPDPVLAAGVHATAVLGKAVRLGDGVAIGPHAVVGDGVRIGARTRLEAGVVVGAGVVIGADGFLGARVSVYPRVTIGDRVRIHAGSVIGADGFGYVFDRDHYEKIPQVGTVVIEDDVELGANVCVDRATLGATRIGRGTKIDNQVQVAHNDQIGRHVTMSGQVGLAGSVTVGDYAVLAGKAGAADHITIGERAVLAAASIAVQDVPPGETHWGNPNRPIQAVMRQIAALARLPELMRRLRVGYTRLQAAEDKLDRLEGRSPPRT